LMKRLGMKTFKPNLFYFKKLQNHPKKTLNT
jgi:hypothetical protein